MATDTKSEHLSLAPAITALEVQLTRLTTGMKKLENEIAAGNLTGLGRAASKLALIQHWLEIAQDMENRIEQQRRDGHASGQARGIDLDEARSQIGCRLDRLRRARCPGRFPK